MTKTLLDLSDYNIQKESIVIKFITFTNARVLYMRGVVGLQHPEESTSWWFYTNDFFIIDFNHVEAIHFPATFSYSCDQCGTTVRSKNALNIHVTKNHRNKTLNQVQPYDTMQ